MSYKQLRIYPAGKEFSVSFLAAQTPHQRLAGMLTEWRRVWGQCYTYPCLLCSQRSAGERVLVSFHILVSPDLPLYVSRGSGILSSYQLIIFSEKIHQSAVGCTTDKFSPTFFLQTVSQSLPKCEISSFRGLSSW